MTFILAFFGLSFHDGFAVGHGKKYYFQFWDKIMSKPILVAVDGGSGNISIAFTLNDEITTASIPARIRQGNAQAYDAEATTTWRTIDENGEETTYSVVSKARDLIDTCDPDYQISAAHRVLVVNALAQMGLGGKDIIIGETLPANQYYGAERLDTARIEAKKKSLLTPVTNFTGKLKSPNIIGVKVYPEAVPAVFSASITEEGELDPRFAQLDGKLVVDLGRFTCDIAYLDKDNNLISKYTSENGVHTLLKELHAMIVADADKLGIKDAKSIQYDALDRYIRETGRIVSAWDDSKSIDLREYIDRAITSLIHRIKTDIRACWRDLNTVDLIIVVGGGANYVGGLLPYMKKRDLSAAWDCFVHIPDYPEFAIVRGVHLSMQHSEDAILAQFTKEA